ncbi:hypothetical protein NH340_JMT02536 [Sarcoptes scabiei]|nr:hypothetical protein NH340_JMT02536 [Sarcoptes scabiei]
MPNDNKELAADLTVGMQYENVEANSESIKAFKFIDSCQKEFEANPIDCDTQSISILSESNELNNNDEQKHSHQQEELFADNGKTSFDDHQNDWNLQNFLNESARLRNDIDVLIMSEAGKPIYCYSRREDVTTLMGVCVALINFVMKSQNDHLKTIRTSNGLNIHFAVRSPLVIVVVCRRSICFDEQTLINQIYAQIISTITLKKLKSIFKQAPTYDLRRIIHMNDFRTLDYLVKSITTPITNYFPTYKNLFLLRKSSQEKLFNNVISFYTSTLVSVPRTISGTNNSNSSCNQNSSLVFLQDHKPNVLSRVYIPTVVMNINSREQIISIINQSVALNNDIVFSVLFLIENSQNESLKEDIDNLSFGSYLTNFSNQLKISSGDDCDNDSNDLYESFESEDQNYLSQESSLRKNSNSDRERKSSSSNGKLVKNFKLISICNHKNKFRINPFDIQLLYALINASDSLLSSTESLWIPICLSRIDPDRFLHAHISYLSSKYCLILLDVDHENFEKCRQVKETIQFRLDQIRQAEPIFDLRSNISELGQPQLQYICHQTLRHCIVWQSSIQTEYSSLNYYLIDRMRRSSLKTLWLRSMKDQCSLLGWQTATFQLYAQFDGFVTKQTALEIVNAFLKWYKKEEDKLIIKDG